MISILCTFASLVCLQSKTISTPELTYADPANKGTEPNTQKPIVSSELSSNNEYVLASYGSNTRIWQVSTGKIITSVDEDSLLPYHHSAFSPDGERFVTTAFVNTKREPGQSRPDMWGRATVWNTVTGKRIMTLEPSLTAIHSAKYTRDGRYILTSSELEQVVWDARTAKRVQTFQTERGSGRMLGECYLSPDGRSFLSLSSSLYPTALIDMGTKSTRFTISTDDALNAHDDRIVSASFSPDGSEFVTGSLDKSAIIWNTASGKKVRTLSGNTGPVLNVDWSPDGTMIATATANGNVKIWDSQSGRCNIEISSATGFDAVRFSNDNHRVVTGSRDGLVKIWNIANVPPLKVLGSSKVATARGLQSPKSSSRTGFDDSQLKLSLVDWSSLVGKDVFFQYVTDWQMESYGGQKQSFTEKKVTRLKVKEIQSGRAQVLFWDDAMQQEPNFAGWISTDVPTSLPAIDIESEAIFTLAVQLRGKDYANMRTTRLGGEWAKGYNPNIVRNANDIIPYYGLQFGKDRSDKETTTIAVDRPTSFFGGDNTLGRISVSYEKQSDGTWILQAALDSNGAQDTRLGNGKVRLRFGPDGLLKSFEDAYAGEMQIRGVKGEGTAKWSIKRVSTSKG